MTVEGLDLSRAAWRASSYSNNGGACIEVAHVGAKVITVRDSKDPSGTMLAFTPRAWTAFTSTVKG
jgi:Domain of unknown function (DUF397)